MRVFVHEFVTSGALIGAALPPSLLREGVAMRRAVVADLLRVEGVRVVSTRDERAPPVALAGLAEVCVPSAEREAELFRGLAEECDFTLVIAPELGDELARRVARAVEAAGAERVLNSPRLIAAASDKWETCARLRAAGVPTIETCLASKNDWRGWDRPVMKPRDGAGSEGVMRVECGAVPGGPGGAPDGWIVQPFVSGRWLSCTLMFGRSGCTVFPPAEQRIAGDGTFTYLGGVVPAECDVEGVQRLAERAIEALCPREEIVGPVGVDLVQEAVTGDLLVSEVNPRFTTSYVGARELTRDNLLAGLIDPEAPPITWRRGWVEFDAEGRISM